MAGALARAIGAVAVFFAAILMALASHLDLPPARRAIVARVDELLAPLFAGRVVIERVGGVGLTHVDFADVKIEDPEGRVVIDATGVAGRISTVTLLRSLMGGGDIVIDIPSATVDSARVLIDADETRSLRIANAFTVRSASVETTTGAAGRSVRLSMPDARVRHASVRGRPTEALPVVDADVDGAEASLFFGDGKFSLDVHRARWAGRGVPGLPDERARGDAEVHLALPSTTGRALEIRVLSRGDLATIAFGADVAYDGGDLFATVDVPAATPDAMRAILPTWPVQLPVGLHAEARGPLASAASAAFASAAGRLAARAHASVGATAVDLDGTITLEPALGATLHLVGKQVDASAFVRGAPNSDLSVAGDVSISTTTSGGFDAHAGVEIGAGRVSAASTPPATLTMNVSRAASEGAEVTVSARGAVHEPGAPTVVVATLVPNHGLLRLSFQADADIEDLSRVSRLRQAGAALRGRATAHAGGIVDVLRGTIDANLDVSTEGFDAPGAHADRGHAEVRATGLVGDPSFDVELSGAGIEAGPMKCALMRAGGRLRLADGVTLENVDVSLRSSDEQAHAIAKLLRFDGDRIWIDQALVDGFGAPIEGSLRMSPGELYVQARTNGLDLARIARFARAPVTASGRVSLDVDATVTARVADGRVAVDASDVSVDSVSGVGAHVELTLHGHEAAGSIKASVADVGSLDVQSTSIHVGEAGPLVLSSWRRAWGAIDLSVHMNLAKAAARLPSGVSPFAQVSGALDLRARVARDSSNDATPAVDASVSTTGLLLSEGTGAGAWRLEGVDPTVDVTVDGETGATAVAASVRDSIGPILELTAESTAVPYGSVFRDGALGDAFRWMPFDAHLDVPDRELESLPASLGLSTLRGVLSASVDWHGSLLTPNIRAAGSLQRSRIDRATSSLPVDLAIAAAYDGTRATASLRGANKANNENVVIDASATLDARAADVVAGVRGAAEIPWTASARVKLDAFPLRSFTYLSDRQVRGKATGLLTLDALHDDARASAKIALDGLTVGEVVCRSASLDAAIDGRFLDASARIEQADAASGYVEAHAHTGVRWGRALAPTFDKSQAADITVAAKQFRAAILYPLVSGVFASIDGRIDAAAHVSVEPGVGARPQGTVKLTDGSFELSTLGGEFGDVSAQVTMTPDGLITLQQAVAHGITGKLEAAATVRMNGFDFAGARGTVQVPKSEPIPVVFDGVQMGMMSGHVDVGAELSRSADALDVTVGIPAVHMELPASGAHDVQVLGDIDKVAIGVHRGEADFVDLPLDATFGDSGGQGMRRPIRIAITLGKDVEVSRGPELDVRLQGQPTVTIADEVRVSGQIRITRGTIDVNGKPFQIENGVITFSGDDPGNPQVVLTAEWTAQDQTRVYADFSGPLKSGKVTLRSDPTLPGGQNDIRALLLFGTTESDTSVNQQAAPVAGAAGNVATQPINRFLSGVNRTLDNIGLVGGISTKIDTSQANPRPEVELQIARDISLQVAWVLGLPVPGSNPDLYYVTLDWRFLRAWSLEATRGDQGTSILDFVWQHRY